jgi:Phage integrase family
MTSSRLFRRRRISRSGLRALSDLMFLDGLLDLQAELIPTELRKSPLRMMSTFEPPAHNRTVRSRHSRSGPFGSGSTANAGYATARCSILPSTASCEDVTSSKLVSGGQICSRAVVIQQKTGRPVQFELLESARGSILAWLERRGGTIDEFAFPSRVDPLDHISTRQYARLVDEWVTGIGLPAEDNGTHSLRRTKASIIYKHTGNLRAAQILLGHTKIESTVRYLGVDVEDALALAEGTEV